MFVSTDNLRFPEKIQFLCPYKVKTLWEGHKIWKKSPIYFDKTAVYTQYCQNKWQIFSNFCGLFRKDGLYLMSISLCLCLFFSFWQSFKISSCSSFKNVIGICWICSKGYFWQACCTFYVKSAKKMKNVLDYKTFY